MTAPEVADPAVVGLLAAGQYPEGSVFPAGCLNLPGDGQRDAVGVQQQDHHHPGVVCLLDPRILLTVEDVDRLEIELSGQIQQEEQQVVLRQPVHR